MLLGHLADLLNGKLGWRLGEPSRPQTIFWQGEFREYKDKYHRYYPAANVRWLAKTHYWLGAVFALMVAYLLAKLLTV